MTNEENLECDEKDWLAGIDILWTLGPFGFHLREVSDAECHIEVTNEGGWTLTTISVERTITVKAARFQAAAFALQYYKKWIEQCLTEVKEMAAA